MTVHFDNSILGCKIIKRKERDIGIFGKQLTKLMIPNKWNPFIIIKRLFQLISMC